MGASDKVVIDVRINEYMMRGPNPHVPYSPMEIAAQAFECAREGAAMIHYHARDPVTGAPSVDAGAYAETARRIKRDSDLLIMPTLGAATLPSPKDRVAHVLSMAADPATRPDFGPIDMASSNLDRYDAVSKRFEDGGIVYQNTPATWQYLAGAMRDVGVKPMQAFWHVGSIRATEALVEMGVFEEPLYCELALMEGGVFAGHPGTVAGLEAFLSCMPDRAGWNWAVLCFGASLFPVLRLVLERGGHVAIGLGDHSYEELGCPTNAELVARVVRMAREVGREPATPAEARALLL